jgi:hypothetical protein
MVTATVSKSAQSTVDLWLLEMLRVSGAGWCLFEAVQEPCVLQMLSASGCEQLKRAAGKRGCDLRSSKREAAFGRDGRSAKDHRGPATGEHDAKQGLPHGLTRAVAPAVDNADHASRPDVASDRRTTHNNLALPHSPCANLGAPMHASLCSADRQKLTTSCGYSARYDCVGLIAPGRDATTRAASFAAHRYGQWSGL